MGERRTLSALGLSAHGTGELITCSKPEFLNDLRPHINVFVAGRISRLTPANEAGAAAQNIQDTEQLDRGLVRTRQFDLDVLAIILAVAVLAIGPAILATLAPSPAPSSVPLAAPSLPVVAALPPPTPTTSPAARTPRFVGAGGNLRCTRALEIGRSVLLLIAWGVLVAPIVRCITVHGFRCPYLGPRAWQA